MTKEQSRRNFIRLLVLGGASLYLPACTDTPKDVTHDTEEVGPTRATETPAPDSTTVEQKVQEIIEVWDTDEVAFLKQDHQDFARYQVRFNKDVVHTPLVIALCYSTAGVVRAVKIAQQEGLKVAIKSGGHSFEGFSSNDNGLVIDLSFMNAITWDNDNATIQPGCTLSQLYDELLPKNRLIPAGSCGGVGVGGLTLGGGYGFFSRKFGLTCDNLLGLTMVDAGGQVHEVDGESELLWACRGGGNGNFGVITEFKFKTHPAPKTFQSHRFKAYKLTPDRAKLLLEEWFLFSKDLPDTCFSAFVLNGKTLTLLITNYAEHLADLQKMLDRFTELCDKSTIGTHVTLARALKVYYGRQDPLYFKNASAGLYQSFGDIAGCIDIVLEKVIQSKGLIYQVNTLGGKITAAEFEAQSCYPHRQQLFLSELQAYWERDAHGTLLKERFAEVQTIFANHGIDKQYRNYPNLTFSNWQQAYYGNNYERLQQVKQRYDPGDLFQHPQSVSTVSS